MYFYFYWRVSISSTLTFILNNWMFSVSSCWQVFPLRTGVFDLCSRVFGACVAETVTGGFTWITGVTSVGGGGDWKREVRQTSSSLEKQKRRRRQKPLKHVVNQTDRCVRLQQDCVFSVFTVGVLRILEVLCVLQRWMECVRTISAGCSWMIFGCCSSKPSNLPESLPTSVSVRYYCTSIYASLTPPLLLHFLLARVLTSCCANTA